MSESRMSNIVTRIAVALIVVSVAVNFATGPGAPTIVDGAPALVSHGTAHPVSWPVYWLNSILFVGSILAVLGAFLLRRIQFSGARREQPARPPGALFQERHISAVVDGRHYNLVVDACLTPIALELRRSLGGGEVLRLPNSDIPVIWFTRSLNGWKINLGGAEEPFRIAQLYPRNPRRWYEVLSRLNIPIRPADLVADQLPSVQLGWLASVGCTILILILFVLGILAMLASNVGPGKP